MEDRNNIISSTDTSSAGSVQRVVKTLKITRRQQIRRATLAVPAETRTTLITVETDRVGADRVGAVHRYVLSLAARRWRV